MNDSPFTVRGVIEGFYGTFYTFPERNELIRFLGAHAFTHYFYGPKNDRHHRSRWREPYPRRFMMQFAQSTAIARDAGVVLVYAISPGESIAYSSAADFDSLTRKLRAFYDSGVRAFSLFLDDIPSRFRHEVDAERYESYGVAHAELCNRTLAWLRELDPAATLSMCPTDYHGAPPFSDYLQDLGAQLDPEVDVFYTGPRVCSPKITVADVASFADVVRRPPIIWDNYPVNDLAMQPEMHIGPIRGREPALYRVTRGIAANLMLQPEASKIPLQTFGAYFADPHGYEAEAAWAGALQDAGVEKADALRLLAENSLHSCLGTPEAARLAALVQAAVEALEAGEAVAESAAVQALAQYLDRLDEACYELRHYLPNLALRRELLPWSERLNGWQELGRRALELLEEGAVEAQHLRRFREVEAELACRCTRIADDALRPLLEYVRARLPEATGASGKAGARREE